MSESATQPETNLSSESPAENGRSNIIDIPSLHKKNFEHYITQYATANKLSMTSEAWKTALSAARRLDYTGNRDAEPSMRLRVSQPSLVSRLMGRLLGRRAQQEHLSELDDIQAYLAQRAEAAAQQSQITWGPLRNGFGTWVIAILRAGGQQKGSRPTPARLRDTPGWELLAARRLLNGRALYVRGHLLHHEPGGAGLDYNWVILTAAPRGDFGANHANWAHRNLVEGILLWAYENMRGVFGTATVTEIYYDVVADYNRQPRTETQELWQIAKAYEKAAKLVQAKAVAEGGGGVPAHEEVMRELAKKKPSPHLHDACLAVAAEAGEEWDNVHERMLANQQLWQIEDANVPKALHIRYSWVENGVLKGPHQETVSIILPSSLAARFKT